MIPKDRDDFCKVHQGSYHRQKKHSAYNVLEKHVDNHVVSRLAESFFDKVGRDRLCCSMGNDANILSLYKEQHISDH